MELPMISCICPTFNRIDKLEEMIACFLAQDYKGKKELLILNDCPKQKLIFNHPEVRIWNHDTQFNSLCNKHRTVAALSSGDMITVWDDDDIKLPHALSFCVSEMRRLKTSVYYPNKTLASYENDKYRLVHSEHFHLNGMWTRAVYDSVGGYDDTGEYADNNLQKKFTDRGVTAAHINVEDLYGIYRINSGVKQISFNHTVLDSNNPTSIAYREMIAKRAIEGEYELKPGLLMDYPAIVKQTIAEKNYVHDIYMLAYDHDTSKLTVYATAGAVHVEFIDKTTGRCVYGATGISADDVNSNWFRCTAGLKDYTIYVRMNGILRYTYDTGSGTSMEFNQKKVRAPKCRNPLKVMGNLLDLEGKVCAEIGVLRGEFSVELAACSPRLLVLVDCWRYQPEGYVDTGDFGTYRSANTEDSVQEANYQHVVKTFEAHPNVSIVRKFSEDACTSFKDEFFDFVYIDANHGYAPCLTDIRIWYNKVKPGGWITGHDLSWATVACAVSTFCNENNLEFLELSRDSWAIRKPEVK